LGSGFTRIFAVLPLNTGFFPFLSTLFLLRALVAFFSCLERKGSSFSDAGDLAGPSECV